jgi:hypothetical protein
LVVPSPDGTASVPGRGRTRPSLPTRPTIRSCALVGGPRPCPQVFGASPPGISSREPPDHPRNRTPDPIQSGTGQPHGWPQQKDNNMTKPKQTPKVKPAEAEASAVVDGPSRPVAIADPVAMVQREVVALVNPAAVYRPAPNDSAPADVPQCTWSHADSYSADGASMYDEAYGAIRLSIIGNVRIGTTVNLPNRGYGTTEVAGIGGVNRVDQLAGGLLVGVPVHAGGEPKPFAGEDRVNVFTLTRAITLWCITPDGEQRAVTFTPESGPYALGVKTLAPVNNKPRSQPLWLAVLPLMTTDDVLATLARVEAVLISKTSDAQRAEVAEPTEVLTV